MCYVYSLMSYPESLDFFLALRIKGPLHSFLHLRKAVWPEALT